MTMAIQAIELTRRFGAQTAVDALSFEVARGEVVGLVGPNGCGKTTSVRLLNGVIRADAGRATVLGLDVARDGEQVRRACGVLTESAAFYAHLSALENLKYFAALQGGDEARAHELLERLGLANAKDRKVGAFSTGMKRRLGLARALLHRPRVLFLDEPTNGLDPEGIRDVLGMIRTMHEEEGVTVVLCSHLLEQLETVCERYLVMDAGRLVAQGTLEALARQVGAPSMALEVETAWAPADGRVAGRVATRRGPDRLVIEVPERELVPGILRELTARAPIFSARLLKPTLSDLYFRIREVARAPRVD